MGKQKKNKRRFSNDALFALDDIHVKYKSLSSSDVEKFVPVYYPIAMVEMYLEELTFEDFDTVQQSILNLCDIGITDGQVIAETLGLSFKYVKGVLNVLYGTGLTDENGNVTPNGHESLRCGQKIVQSKVWQKFQVDALNGTLLQVDQTIDEESLSERNDTDILVGHLNYMDGMPASELVEQLTCANSSAYIHQSDGILNTNVTSVEDIKCDGIDYARCYMMRVWNCEEPIIFAKRYDSTKKTMQDRYSWMPLFVPNETIRKRYEFEEDIPVRSKLCRNYVMDLQDMVLTREKEIKLSNKIEDTLKHVYPFDFSGVDLSRMDASIVPDIVVNESAFKKYRPWILNLLIGLYNDGEYLVTNERLYGYVIALRSESQLMNQTASLAAHLAGERGGKGRLELMKAVKDKFTGVEKEGLIADLYAYMGKLKIN